jgi:hypothetical protein
MLVHLAAAAVLAANPVTPPPDLPDLPEEPVVTELGNLELVWTADRFPRLLVTWDEPGPLANRVDILEADGTLHRTVRTLASPDPNRVLLDPWPIERSGIYRVAVHELDADGEPVGDPALSPVFDNDRPPAPRIDAVVPRPDGTVELRWTTVAPGPDSTPGDPLDLPAEPQRVVPIAGTGDPFSHDELSEPVAGTSFVVPATVEAPYDLGVKAVNEWGESFSGAVDVHGTTVTAQVPARATTGARLQVTGLVRGSLRACVQPACIAEEYPGAGRAVQLQARTGAQSAWQVVATARTAADGTYRLGAAFPGTRQYRVVAPPVPAGVKRTAHTFAATAPVTATSVPAASGDASGAGSDGGGAGAGGGLPITGAPAAATAATGALLVTFGVLLCAVGRRPRRAR